MVVRLLLTLSLLVLMPAAVQAQGGAVLALIEAPTIDAEAFRSELSRELQVPVVGLNDPLSRMVRRRLLVTASTDGQVALLFEEPGRGQLTRDIVLVPESETMPAPLVQLQAQTVQLIAEASQVFAQRSEVLDPFRSPLLTPVQMTEVLDPFPDIPRTSHRVRLSSEVIDPFVAFATPTPRARAPEVLDPWRHERADHLSAPSPTH